MLNVIRFSFVGWVAGGLSGALNGTFASRASAYTQPSNYPPPRTASPLGPEADGIGREIKIAVPIKVQTFERL
jgi:hypothetical protein